jgi:hypothetical protein
MSTDFFDDDLSSNGAQGSKAAARQEAPARVAPEGVPAGRMVRRKEELTGHVVGAANEIERLRLRQEEIEREKATLENLSRKQEEYEKGKQDIIEKLDRSILLLENEEVQAAHMVELLSSMRVRFKDMLSGLRSIDEETWSEETFGDEMNKALALVEEARMFYKKGVSKIDATRWSEDGERPPVAAEESLDGALAGPRGFGDWFKAGVAFSLPLAAVIVVLFVIYLTMNGSR